MSELKLPRLLAAAKEFNVGQDTLLNFLVGKGFNRDELKPTAKLNEAMYRALQQEFHNDKTAKNKADLVEIPKSQTERKPRREEEDISIKRDEKKTTHHKEEVVETVAVVKEEPQPQPVVLPEPVQPEPELIVPVEEPEIQEEEAPVILQTEPAEPEMLRIEAPEIEAPKVVDKIDLSTIDSSTRPRKNVIPKQEEPIEPEVVEEPVVIAPEVEEEEMQPDEEMQEPELQEEEQQAEPQEFAPLVENIKAEKIEGPKILGKIDLPVDNDTRPKHSTREEKRKRKRIPVDKKGETSPQAQTSFNPQARGANNGQPTFNRERNITPQRANANGQGTAAQQGANRPAFQNKAGQSASTGPRIQINRNVGGNRGGQSGSGHGRNDRFQRPDDKEIDQKQIQDKIRETQAKLAGQGGRGKSLKARHRREKRHEAAEAMGNLNEDNKLQVTEFVTVSELANLMDVNFTDIISKCMSLGIMVSINQR